MSEFQMNTNLFRGNIILFLKMSFENQYLINLYKDLYKYLYLDLYKVPKKQQT